MTRVSEERLRDAAADLLAALLEARTALADELEMRGTFDNDYGVPIAPIMPQIDAAIAKARGAPLPASPDTQTQENDRG